MLCQADGDRGRDVSAHHVDRLQSWLDHPGAFNGREDRIAQATVYEVGPWLPALGSPLLVPRPYLPALGYQPLVSRSKFAVNTVLKSVLSHLI
jgi:hypothetical protein